MKRSLMTIAVLAMWAGAGASGAATPPSTHLQKGEWAYHSVVKITSGMMAGRTFSKSWKICAKNDRDAAQSLMPRTKRGDTTCTKPTLSYSKSGYHTVMHCVTKANGMTSKIREDFLLKPGHQGTTFQAHGKVDQQLMIASMPARKMHMTVDVTGKRTGVCKD